MKHTESQSTEGWEVKGCLKTHFQDSPQNATHCGPSVEGVTRKLHCITGTTFKATDAFFSMNKVLTTGLALSVNQEFLHLTKSGISSKMNSFFFTFPAAGAGKFPQFLVKPYSPPVLLVSV